MMKYILDLTIERKSKNEYKKYVIADRNMFVKKKEKYKCKEHYYRCY